MLRRAIVGRLQLVDRGQLKKTDLLDKWFPDFPNASKITVDDLLRMRSGIAAPSDEEIMEAIYAGSSIREAMTSSML